MTLHCIVGRALAPRGTRARWRPSGELAELVAARREIEEILALPSRGRGPHFERSWSTRRDEFPAGSTRCRQPRGVKAHESCERVRRGVAVIEFCRRLTGASPRGRAPSGPPAPRWRRIALVEEEGRPLHRCLGRGRCPPFAKSRVLRLRGAAFARASRFSTAGSLGEERGR